MPEYRAPAVYIEEIPSGVQSITGGPTSTAAFVGATASSPTNAPVLVKSFLEFQAQFGGLAADMPLGFAVQQYFGNGGREALIVRVVPSGAALTDADLSSPALEQQRRGLWLLEQGGSVQHSVHSAAHTCHRRRACRVERGDRLRHAPPCHRARRSAGGLDRRASDLRDCRCRIRRPQPERCALLSAAAGAGSVARQPARAFALCGANPRHLCAHRRRGLCHSEIRPYFNLTV